MTDRTKKYLRLELILKVTSYIICYGLAIALVIAGINSGWGSSDETLKEKLGTVLYSVGASILVLILLAIIAKDNVKPTVWMIDIILTGYLFGMTYVYGAFALWILDTYIITPLQARFKTKYLINSEIDKRNE